MNSYTPGPWTVSESLYRIVGANGDDVAQTYSGSTTRKFPAEANARLIACAPDLLEIVMRIAQQLNSGAAIEIQFDSLLHSKINQAIAKMEGK